MASESRPYEPKSLGELLDARVRHVARYEFLRSIAYEYVAPHGHRVPDGSKGGSRTGWIIRILPGKSFDEAVDAAIARATGEQP